MTTPEPDRWNLQALRDLGRLQAEDVADYRLAHCIAYQERLEVRERDLRAREAALDARERETSGGETLDELTGRLIWRELELAAREARTLLAWQQDLKAQQAGLRSWRRGLWAWTAGVVLAVFWILIVCAGTLPAGGRP